MIASAPRRWKWNPRGEGVTVTSTPLPADVLAFSEPAHHHVKGRLA
jgi:hypothetical protein